MNESNTPNPGFTFRLMAWAGKYYPIYIIAVARIVFGSFSIFIGNIISMNNSGFTPEQYNRLGWVTFGLAILSDIIIVGGAFFFTRELCARLEQRKSGRPMSEGQAEFRAWRQSNTLALNYGLAAGFIAIVIYIIPLLIFEYVSFQSTFEQLLYSGFSAALTIFLLLISSTIFIDYMMRPVREVVLPSSFENQIRGSLGLGFSRKFVGTTMALLGVTILAIAPLGYSRASQLANMATTTSAFEMLKELQGNFNLVTFVILVLGAILAYALLESVSSPMRELIDVFNRVEKGDFKARARVTASDELGELSIYFNRMLTRIEELQQNLEKRVEDQTEKLRASNEVGRIASTILNPDDLISQVVNLIAKTFDYYYVAVFLVTGNERWAELVDATGSAGEILKARRHRLQVGGSSMVGNAIASKQAQVAMDVGETAVRFNNPLLPNTRSELALPLMVGDRVIGALDVQSVREADFRADDIATLQNLASQVAISIENARLFREMDNALSELRQSNRQYISSVWEEKLQASKLEYSVKSPAIPGAEEIKDIAVNLNLRDQPIGYIHLQTNEEWSQEDQAWVESLATQVAISLENARLVEESNQSALRERLSASIIQKLWSTPSIDGILQTAVRELGRALEASEATIELKVEES